MTVLSSIKETATIHPKRTVAASSMGLAGLFGGAVAAAVIFMPGLRKISPAAKAGLIGGATVAGAALPIIGYGCHRIREEAGQQWVVQQAG